MNLFEQIIYSLQKTMETPTNYGLFHIISIAIVVATTIVVCLLLKNRNEKIFKRFLFVCWLLILILEIYKQIIFSFEYSDGAAKWDYQWYAFPFQFCSLQLYLLPFVIFLKDGKVRDAIIAFLATFSFFGGLAVYIYPNDVFVSTIGINIQTMIHHGLQIVLGILFMVYYHKKLSMKFFLSSIVVFVSCIAVAMILNAIVPTFTTETFNMFYISPLYECTLPILGSIYQKVHYILFLLLYIFGFSLVAFLMYLLLSITIKLINKKTNKTLNS